jgi:ribose transport system ATP-binding protein
MHAGIGMVPRDRTELAVFASWSVKENLTVPQLSVPVACDLDSRRIIGQYGIKTRGPAASIWTLSGGNQQKVVLARWLQRNPKLLLLCEPTAGVDPGARDDLHALLRAAAARGCTILVASTDADELESLAHRTLVLNRGRITSEIEGGPGSKERIREKIL